MKEIEVFLEEGIGRWTECRRKVEVRGKIDLVTKQKKGEPRCIGKKKEHR
jgi:hypothetical protein